MSGWLARGLVWVLASVCKRLGVCVSEPKPCCVATRAVQAKGLGGPAERKTRTARGKQKTYMPPLMVKSMAMVPVVRMEAHIGMLVRVERIRAGAYSTMPRYIEVLQTKIQEACMLPQVMIWWWWWWWCVCVGGG